MMELDGEGPAADPAGAAWRCRFCGTANGPGASRCKSCGASSDAAATDMAGAPPPEERAPKPAGGTGRGWTLATIALAAAVLGSLTVYFARRPAAEMVTVAGFEWERSVEIEDHQTVREESWLDEVPPGAQIVARRRELRRTDRQQVGTRNGQPVYRERPVYGQRVAYDIDRWSVTRTLRASGQGQSPRWPDIRLNLGEREGKRTESYVVLLEGRGVHRIKVPRERWLEMRAGQMGSAVVGKDGALLDLR